MTCRVIGAYLPPPLDKVDAQSLLVEQFHQRFPSNLKIEEVALINGFDDKNARMQPGQSYKRVVGGPPIDQQPHASR